MFENSSVFCILDDGEIRKLNMQGESIIELREMFSDLFENITSSDQAPFHPYYNNDEDIPYIEAFELPQEIIDAIHDSSHVIDFSPEKGGHFRIKSIFIGEGDGDLSRIAFQRIRNNQVVTRHFHIFTSRDTLELSRRPFFTISERADCVFDSGRLLFNKFWSAKQVFSLADYYRVATQEDVENFINNDMFIFDDQDTQIALMDQHMRKKIASIIDSDVLVNKSANDIQGIAQDYGINVNINHHNGVQKIILPDERKDLKTLIKFLDEDLFRGPLSGTNFESNSKRERMD